MCFLVCFASHVALVDRFSRTRCCCVGNKVSIYQFAWELCLPSELARSGMGWLSRVAQVFPDCFGTWWNRGEMA